MRGALGEKSPQLAPLPQPVHIFLPPPLCDCTCGLQVQSLPQRLCVTLSAAVSAAAASSSTELRQLGSYASLHRAIMDVSGVQ